MSFPDPSETAAPSPPPLSRRVSWKYAVVALSALLTFVAVAAALRTQGRTVDVVMALRDLEAGHPLTLADVRTVALSADSPLAPSLLRPPELDGRLVITSRVPKDTPIVRSQVRFVAAPNQLRSISIPVAVEHAVGGTLGEGDRVDVIDAAGTPTYVVRDAEVLAVHRQTNGGLSANNGYAVTIAVNANDALAVAQAISGGRIEIVRATGAEPMNPAAVTAPPPRTRNEPNPAAPGATTPGPASPSTTTTGSATGRDRP